MPSSQRRATERTRFAVRSCRAALSLGKPQKENSSVSAPPVDSIRSIFNVWSLTSCAMHDGHRRKAFSKRQPTGSESVHCHGYHAQCAIGIGVRRSCNCCERGKRTKCMTGQNFAGGSSVRVSSCRKAVGAKRQPVSSRAVGASASCSASSYKENDYVCTRLLLRYC